MRSKSSKNTTKRLRELLGRSLLGYRVLLALLNRIGLNSGAAVALEYIEEIEAELGLKKGEVWHE